MRITESKLRRIIRNVIIESINNEKNYPFDLQVNLDFSKDKYYDDIRLTKIVNFDKLCVTIAGIAEHIVYSINEMKYDDTISEEDITETILSSINTSLNKDSSDSVIEAIKALLQEKKSDRYFGGRAGELSDGYESDIHKSEVGAGKLITLIKSICTESLGF